MTNPQYDLVLHQAANYDEGYPFQDIVASNTPRVIKEADGNLPAERIITERIERVPEPVFPQTPAVLHYPKSRDVIQVLSGVDRVEYSLGFNCRAIAIQNVGTNGFLYCPELNIYLTVGITPMNIFDIPSGIDNISFVWHTAAFNTATPAPVVGQYVNVWLYDDWIFPTISGGGSSGGGGAVTFSGQFAEDSASANGDTGLFVLSIRKDAPTNLVSADGDYAALEIDSSGRLWVHDDLSLTQLLNIFNSFKAEDSVSANADLVIPMGAIRKDTPTSLVSADGDYSIPELSLLGEQWTRSVSATAAQSNVSQNAASVTILASNTARKMATVFNDSTSILYLSFSGAASLTNYVVQLPASAYYELPAPVFSGQILGIWAGAGGGAARIMEQT